MKLHNGKDEDAYSTNIETDSSNESGGKGSINIINIHNDDSDNSPNNFKWLLKDVVIPLLCVLLPFVLPFVFELIKNTDQTDKIESSQSPPIMEIKVTKICP